ncbi:MAG TPA: GIY-YIG nuclease family protein [Pseudolabrys sp.]|jgi:putative endonuclease|nr:GIY-YIG nuclease family protein [Pseudolabrys sp.]
MASVKPRKKTRRKDSAFVYVLGCLAGARHLTYVGWTNDVARRLAKHNAGTGARSTRGRTWVLLHSERFADKRAAMSREWHLKRDRGFRKQLAQALRERTKT